MTSPRTLREMNVPRDIVPVTASDTDDLVDGCIGLYVTVAGNVAVRTATGGETTRTLAVAANSYHSLSVTRVLSTGTTATGIHALYA